MLNDPAQCVFPFSAPPLQKNFCPVWLTVLFITSARGLHGQFSSDMTNTNTQNPALIESLHLVERKFLISFKVTLSPLKHGKGHDSHFLFFLCRHGILYIASPCLLPPYITLCSFPNFHWPALLGGGAPLHLHLLQVGRVTVHHHQAAASLYLLNMNQTNSGENYNHTSKYLSNQSSRALELNHGHFILFEGCILVSTKKKKKKTEDNCL